MSALAIERDAAETAFSYRLALAGDAIADAARLIAVNALAAEGAARRGDETVASSRNANARPRSRRSQS